MKKTNILWGIVLILLGVFIGLNRFNLINVKLLFDGWWTLFIIIPSFIGIFDKNGRIFSIFLFIIGILLLLNARDIIEYKYISKLILPVILVLIGLKVLFKDANNKVKVSKDTDFDDVYATFSAEKVKYDKVFEKAELNAIFGSLEYDLSNSKIKEDAYLESNSVFGSIKIYVPKDVKVVLKSTSIFGGVKNNSNNEDGKILYINATCLFGGLEIDER